jgi:hypothetical protein
MVVSLGRRFLHTLSWYAVWLVCLYSAVYGQAWFGLIISLVIIALQLLWEYRVTEDFRGLWRFLLVMPLLGFLTDSLLVWCRVLVYTDNIFSPYLSPPWIAVQWIEFAVVSQVLLKYLWGRPITTGLLGFFGFTFAYLGGARFGAVILSYGIWSALLVGFIWMILLPLLFLGHNSEVKRC